MHNKSVLVPTRPEAVSDGNPLRGMRVGQVGEEDPTPFSLRPSMQRRKRRKRKEEEEEEEEKNGLLSVIRGGLCRRGVG